MDNKALDDELEQLLQQTERGVTLSGTDWRLMRPSVLLGVAVRRLDETSTKLPTANVRLAAAYTGLTVVLVVLGIIQICVTRGH